MANSWWNSRPNQNYKSAHILVNLAIVKIVKGLTFCGGKTGVSMQRIIWNGYRNVKTCSLPNMHQGSVFWMCLQIPRKRSSINVQNHMDDNSFKLQTLI